MHRERLSGFPNIQPYPQLSLLLNKPRLKPKQRKATDKEERNEGEDDDHELEGRLETFRKMIWVNSSYT